MLTVYIICTVVGGALILLSLLGADHGHDADSGGEMHFDAGHDLSHDVDHDHGHDLSWLPFFSLRFWTYFAAVTGLCGVLLTKFTATPEPTLGFMSAGAGFLTGLSVVTLMRLFRRFESDSSTKTADLMGVVGTVVVPIRPGIEGKIRCTVKNDILEFLAHSERGEAIEMGAQVVIVGIENDRARVISSEEIYSEMGATNA